MTIIEEKNIFKAPIEEIWNFVTEPDNFSKYILGYIKGKILSQNKTGLDSEFEWYTKFWRHKFRSVEKVTEWNKFQKVAYHGTLSSAEFWSQMIFNKMNSNTELTIIIEYKMPYSIFGWLLNVLYFKRRVHKEVLYSLKIIKQAFDSV